MSETATTCIEDVFQGNLDDIDKTVLEAPLTTAAGQCCSYYHTAYSQAAEKERQAQNTGAADIYRFLSRLCSFYQNYGNRESPYRPFCVIDGQRGYIGAVLQGACMGIPGLAVSLQTEIENHHVHADLDWGAARHFTEKFTKMMLSGAFPKGQEILNVNIPAHAYMDTEWRATRQSLQPYFTNIVRNPSKDSAVGDGECVIGYDEQSLEPDSDISAIVNEGVVSVSPLGVDLSAKESMRRLKEMYEKS